MRGRMRGRIMKKSEAYALALFFVELTGKGSNSFIKDFI